MSEWKDWPLCERHSEADKMTAIRLDFCPICQAKEITRLQTELAEAKNIGGEILQELFAKTAALDAAQATIAEKDRT